MRFILVASVAVPTVAFGQEQPDTTRLTITGTTVDAVTGAILRGVTVEIFRFGVVMETDSIGEFEVSGLRPGSYRMALSLAGYSTVEGSFEVMTSGEFTVPMSRERGIPEQERLVGRFIGRVTDAEGGRPLEDVGVRIPELSMGVLTDGRGRFKLEDVPVGLHLVEFEYLGYAERVETVRIVAGQTSDARLALTVEAIDLEPIEVTVERRELALEDVQFYDRRERGYGEFIDIEDIEERNPARMTDIFNRMPGVKLIPDQSNPLERNLVFRGGEGASFSGAPCYPSVWLDGAQVHRGGSYPVGIDRLVDPQVISGIEVYQTSAGVPARYGGLDASCGVLLIWTRR